MDDETLKDMVADIMRELGEEYSQRFGGGKLCSFLLTKEKTTRH